MNFSFENRGSEAKINFLSFQNDKVQNYPVKKIFEKCRDYYSRIKNGVSTMQFAISSGV